jgi:hypothetical protein
VGEVPWGDIPYDSKTPAQVVHDYAVIRGDLSEQYARDQLSGWIERYAQHAVATRLARVEAFCVALEAEDDYVRSWKCARQLRAALTDQPASDHRAGEGGEAG